MQVQIQNLRKNYGATKAVNDISFTFTSGQVFGFVGPNGAGKSTTMRVLAALEEPTSGDCFVDGVSVRLCWLEGDRELAWYHRTELGFLGRRRLP